MFKSILLITTLVALGNAYSNQVATTSLSGNSGYVYGPPQGANFNYDVAKSYGRYNGAVSSWSNNLQYPRINTLVDGYAYNSGITPISALAAPYAQGYQWNQRYNWPGYNTAYNSGYNGYNTGYNGYNYQAGYNRPYPINSYTGWNYNRPYYSTIQNHQ